MTREAEWIAVDLTAEEVRQATVIARIRGERPGVTQRRFHGGEQDWRRRDLPGALGECAVRKYLGLPFEEVGRRREADPAYRDAGRFAVRTVDARHKRLRLNYEDNGLVILAYAHQCPRIWLAGWGQAEDLITMGQPFQRDDRPCVLVSPSFLQPLRPMDEPHG